MGQFNLIDEGWIPVIYKDTGDNRELSLREIFEDADKIKSLSTDSPTQDFAVLRILLAILHTVYSRYNYESEIYPEIQLDEKFRQKEDIEDTEELRDYKNNLIMTWKKLWENRNFTRCLYDYLDNWHDRFFLFDEEYPFFQVKASDITEDIIKPANASTVAGKNINRLISESGNKVALFSPKFGDLDNQKIMQYQKSLKKENKVLKLKSDFIKNLNWKDILSSPEIARWLITFQAYSGVSDKTKFIKLKYNSTSKGWLFDLGGVYLEGENFFETLMLNLVLVHPQGNYSGKIQKPCWEYSSEELLREYMLSVDSKTGVRVESLAQLYTIWSKAIFIDPKINVDQPFYFKVVKLPDLEHQNQFLETMTMWRYNKNGKNKGTFTPRKHQIGQSLWRNFGLISLKADDEDNSKARGVIQWFELIKKLIGEDYRVSVKAISMQDDGNSSSRVPVNEIDDILNVKEDILTDLQDDGAVIRIGNIVEQTKKAVGTYRIFINNIREIRNLESRKFVDDKVEEMYYLIDQPFKNWISSIDSNEQIPDKIIEWRKELKILILNQADVILNQAGNRDYMGIEKNDKIMNIATAYNSFRHFLLKTLNIKEGA